MKLRLPALAIALLAWPGSLARAQGAEGADHARLRWEWFYRQRAYPLTQVPAGALQRARAQLSALRLTAPPPIAGTSWQPIGPTLINGTAIGRTSVIALHPTDASVMYVGGAQGGVWKTTNAGASWSPLTDKQCSLAMGSIAIDPVNPEIVYAATGEQHFSGDSYYGCGVLRSSDGGATWSQFGGTTFQRARIARIVIVPSTAGSLSSATLFAASDNGLWRSTQSGSAWTLVRSGIATDVALDPTNAQTVYVAVRGQGVFRSTDGGSTWLPLGAGFPTADVGRIMLGLSPSNPALVYAAVANITSSSGLLGLYKTTDGAATWTKLTATVASCGTQCWYDLHVTVHPASPDTLYFGGVSLYRSNDGGQTFLNVTRNMHVDQHYFVFDPRDPSIVYATNDGGVYRSADGAASWTSLNSGLALTQFYSGISLHPWDNTVVIAGTQDNGTLMYSAAPNWTAILGGDGGFTAIDFENPARRYAETQWSSGIGGPRRSDGGSFVLKRTGIDTNDPALFIPPLVMDPTDPRTLYFGTNKVYRTVNSADNWTAISPVFTGSVTAIAPAPSDPSIVYAATAAGQLQVMSGAEGWALRNSGLPARSITDIAVDRSDANIAFVTVSGFGTGHVFRTANRGLSWTNVSGNLPDMPVNAVSLDPANQSFVMLGTDLGVFISTNGGTAWTALDDGMPNVAVFDIAYNAATGQLIAATHGRGMFQLQLNRPLTLAAVPTRRRSSLVENRAPDADSAAVVLSGTGAATSAWTATHSSAATWLTLTTSSGTGSGRARWTRTAGLAPGVYVDTIRISAAGAVDSPALVIDSLTIISSVPVLTLNPPMRKAVTFAESPLAVPDSAQVAFGGQSGDQQAWTASARIGTWLTVTTGAGVGSGYVRWTRSANALNIGTYVDTIVVGATGAVGSPGVIIDSLVVQPALAFASASRSDTVVSGSSETKSVTVALTSRGDPGGSAAWTVAHGPAASWLSLTTVAGQGTGTVSWTKTGANQRDGIFVDTVVVSAPVGLPAVFFDTLVVIAPQVARTCVIEHALGASCLDATQLRWLDLAGNRDGTYNLGDLLLYLRRPVTPGAPAAARVKRP